MKLQFLTKQPKSSRGVWSATCKVFSSSSSSKSKVLKQRRRRVRARVRIEWRTKSAFHNLYSVLKSFFSDQTGRFFWLAAGLKPDFNKKNNQGSPLFCEKERRRKMRKGALLITLVLVIAVIAVWNGNAVAQDQSMHPQMQQNLH